MVANYYIVLFTFICFTSGCASIDKSYISKPSLHNIQSGEINNLSGKVVIKFNENLDRKNLQMQLNFSKHVVSIGDYIIETGEDIFQQIFPELIYNANSRSLPMLKISATVQDLTGRGLANWEAGVAIKATMINPLGEPIRTFTGKGHQKSGGGALGNPRGAAFAAVNQAYTDLCKKIINWNELKNFVDGGIFDKDELMAHKSTIKHVDQNLLVETNLIGKRWAVIIGISAYKDTRIPALRYAAADAQAFYDWIVSSNGGKYAPANVKLLIGRDATLPSIKRALFNWLKQALAEDVVTIYFAGHGSPESPDYPNNLFLLSYDAKYDDIATTSFPMWDIETALKRFIKAKKVIVIADACHAGGVGQSFDIARRANRAIKVNPISMGLQNLSRVADGVVILSASDDKQFSQEGEKWGGGHGVFTYFLVKGLNGEADYNKDKRVTLGELIPHLSEQVRRATRNAQSPTVAGKFDPALSIGR